MEEYNESTISGTTEVGAIVKVTIDGTEYSPEVNGETGSWSVSVPALADGSYDIKVNATDEAGNTAEEHTTIKIDNTSPTIVTAEAVGVTVVEVVFDEDLQNNSEGHHPAVSDFDVYNANSELSYGIKSVSYDSEDKKVTIVLTNGIEGGDDPKLYVRPMLASLVDLAGNFFNNGNEYDMDIADKIVPVITILGSETVNLIVGDAYEDAGATASDSIDGDISQSIVKEGTFTDTSAVGTYTVTYDVTDNSGNTAEQKVRTIIVSEEPVPDTTNPVITLLGLENVNVFVGTVYEDAGATASDNKDGDITEDIVVNNPVNVNVPDNYLVTYNVTDKAGNHALQVTRAVRVMMTSSGGGESPSPVGSSPSVSGEGSGSTSGNTGTGQVLGVEKFIFLNDMYFGSRLDPDVKELQERLRSEGFFTFYKSTGYFGPITKAAVKAYQTAHTPLKVDGIVGPFTRAELNK